MHISLFRKLHNKNAKIGVLEDLEIKNKNLPLKNFCTLAGLHVVYGVISIFLRAIVLQPDSPTECIDNPTFCIDSPTKPNLAVFSPTNRWSYSTVGLSIQWSRPVYRKSYFS